MAITFTSRGAAVNSSDLDTYTINPLSDVTIGELVLVAINCFDNTSVQPGQPTVTGNGITYTHIRTQDVDTAGADRATAFLFAGIPTSDASGNITVDFPFTGGNLANAMAHSVVEVTGADLTGGASGAFVSANTVGASGQSTTPSVNYAQAIASGNACFALSGHQNISATHTPRTNWTELADVGLSNTSLATEYRVTGADTETAASGTITSTRWGIIAVEVKAASTAVTLTVADAAQAQTTDNIALTQVHNLTVDDMVQSQTTDSPTVTQVHNLVVADAAQAQAMDSPTIAVVTVLTVADMAQPQVADSVTLTQLHILAVSDAAQTQTTDAVALVQQHTLAVADAAQQQTIDSAALAQTHVLTVDAMAQAQSTESPVVNSAANLAIADMAQGQTVDSPALAQLHVLAVDPAAQAQTADSVALTQLHVLALAGMAQAATTDSAALVQQHALAIVAVAQAQVADEVTLQEFTGLPDLWPIHLGTYRETTTLGTHRVDRGMGTHEETIHLGTHRENT